MDGVKKKVTVLGSTGSVGKSTVDILKHYPDRFETTVLTAHANVGLLARQATELRARHAVIGDETLYPELKQALAGHPVEVSAGRQALLDAAAIPADITVAAIVGMAGLEPVLQAVRAGHIIAIANKEPLVAAGALLLREAAKSGARLLPIDSEHNGVFQILDESTRKSLVRVILTASGGPFRDWTMEEMRAATPAQAVAHPNWAMGAKISVDSATMMNKGLELIEAHHLFSLPPEKIDILVHRQSVVHAMAEYADGSVLAHMGAPDMTTPIIHALGYPERLKTPGRTLDWTALSRLDFQPADDTRFPAIRLAYECIKAGQAACIAFNAANEVAVAAFLKNETSFLDIAQAVHHILNLTSQDKLDNLYDIIAYDDEVRRLTAGHLCGIPKTTTVRTCS